METVLELIEVLKKTPELALWGLSIFFFFTLVKMASWVGALTVVAKLFLQKFFAWKESRIEIEKTLAETKAKVEEAEIHNCEAMHLVKVIDRDCITTDATRDEFYMLLRALKGLKTRGESPYVHTHDVKKAREIIEKYKFENDGNL